MSRNDRQILDEFAQNLRRRYPEALVWVSVKPGYGLEKQARM